MACATLTFDSTLLHRPVTCAALLPEDTTPKGVLVFLHGYTNRYDSVLHYSALERYLLGVPLAVVMPDVQCSFYMDTAYGQPFWRHVTCEIPEKLHQWLKLEVPRERRFVAGASMGGYGAAKMALCAPRHFAKAFLFSPVTDMVKVAERGFDQRLDAGAPALEDLHMDALLGGRQIRNSEDDLYYLLEKVNVSELPQFTVYTGTEDFLYSDIVEFVSALERKGARPEIHTTHGVHGWQTWDPFLAQMAAKIAAAL